MDPRQYRNFTLRISPVAEKPDYYSVQIYGLIPGGQPRSDEKETIKYDPEVFVFNNLNLLDAVQLGQMTRRLLYSLGTSLADMLFTGSIRKRWWDSLNVVRERRLGLRLRLLFEAPELVALPWEFLYLRPPYEKVDCELYFLALQPEVSIVRHEMLDIAEPSLIPQSSYRLVAALSSPKDQPSLALAAERSAIEQAMAKLPQVGLIQTTWIEKGTKQALKDALRTPADILHFSGHGRLTGDGGQIILESENGGSDPYAATSLASLIQASPLRLAILNACETGSHSGNNPWSGVATALVHAGVAAVIASQYPILDSSSTPLAEEIYLGIMRGLTIDEVVSNARRAIYQDSGIQNPDWGSPVLFLRAEQGFIFPPVSVQVKSQSSLQQPNHPDINIHVTQTFNGPVSGSVSGVEANTIGAKIESVVPQLLLKAIPNILPPRQDTLMLGRDDELNKVQVGLETGSKIYFYGIYGVGKTSMAAELYRRLKEQKTFVDGCIWDRVSRLSAEKVLDRIAGNFTGQKVAAAISYEEKIQALSDLLVDRDDVLIALDEVEDKMVAKAVIQATGNCTVILNGTQRLNLAGAAVERRLKPLERSVAEELFRVLARPTRTEFNDEEAVIVTDICRRMRYLPLAIKLAALKYAEGTESLQELADRLTLEPETLLPEDGVIAVFTAHYTDLKLMPTALKLLIRIASFPALEVSLKALQEGQTDFFSSKDKLLDLGLVDYIGSDRLALHPLLGNQVQIVEQDAIEPERDWAEHWLTAYAKHNREDHNAIEKEKYNLLALLDRYTVECRWDDLVALLNDLFSYLRIRGQWQEAFERLDFIVKAADQITQRWNLAWAYLHRGIIHFLRAKYEEAEKDFDYAREIFADKKDLIYQGIVLYQYGRLAGIKGDFSSAKKYLKKALEFMGIGGPPRERVGALNQMAGINTIQGNTSQAQKYYALALDLSQNTGETEEEARIHLALGTLARKAGDLPGAKEHIDHAYQLASELGDYLQMALIHEESGYFYYYQGKFDKAESDFNEAFTIFQQFKYPRGLAQTLHALGNLALAHKKLEVAGGYYTEALNLNQKLGHKADTAYNQYQLGIVASRSELFDKAEKCFKNALDIVQDEKLKDVILQAAAWFQLSKLAWIQNDIKHTKIYANRAKELAKQGKQRFTEGAALYQMALLQAKEGQLEQSRENMALAHAAFVALNAPEAKEIQEVLLTLESGQNVTTTPKKSQNKNIVNVVLGGTPGRYAQRANSVPKKNKGGSIVNKLKKLKNPENVPNLDVIVSDFDKSSFEPCDSEET